MVANTIPVFYYPYFAACCLYLILISGKHISLNTLLLLQGAVLWSCMDGPISFIQLQIGTDILGHFLLARQEG